MSYGDIFPGWEIAELIGIGGSSRVYRMVRKGHPDMQAAVKILSVPDKEAGAVLSGAQRMKELGSVPGLVRIDEVSVHQDGDGHCSILIRMELLRSLRSYLCDKKLSDTEVLEMGMDLCEGLEHCHAADIVHGDIKPDNILVWEGPDGKVRYRLGDFGTASSGQAAEQPDTIDDGVGIECTPEYVAPEQLDGRQDARTDIYALGLTLYRYLNGDRLPFFPVSVRLTSHEDRIGAIRKRLSGAELPPVPGVHKEIMAVIGKACAFRPDDRYMDAAAFREALGHALKAKGAIPRDDQRAGTRLSRRSWMKRAAVVCSAMIMVGFLMWENRRAGMEGSWAGPGATEIPLQKVQILGCQEENLTVRDRLALLKDSWYRMDHDVLPLTLAELPFIVDAPQFIPDMQTLLNEQENSLQISTSQEGWNLLLLTEDGECLAPIPLPDGKSWLLPVREGWEKGLALFSQEAGTISVEYAISCSSGEMKSICILIHKENRTLWYRAHLESAGKKAGTWNVTLKTPEGGSLTGRYTLQGQFIKE